jgi:hypothetical protein
MCFIQGRLIVLPINKILFPSSFWGIFDFLSFSMIVWKKNKRMVHYKGGMSVENIQVSLSFSLSSAFRMPAFSLIF